MVVIDCLKRVIVTITVVIIIYHLVFFPLLIVLLSSYFPWIQFSHPSFLLFFNKGLILSGAYFLSSRFFVYLSCDMRSVCCFYIFYPRSISIPLLASTTLSSCLFCVATKTPYHSQSDFLSIYTQFCFPTS